MKPLIQKLPINEDHSFVARTYRTPNFEVGWHQHMEYELILFSEGSGLSFIGNHVGAFEKGDIYLLGSNLPHSFQKRDTDSIASAVVVQFTETFWGNQLLSLPETSALKTILYTAHSGLKITGKSRQKLRTLITKLETATGLTRLITLMETLNIISSDNDWSPVSTQDPKQLNLKDQTKIDQIFQFTIDNFKEPVSLGQVANIACLTVPAFCTYFKRSTKKTYIEFLNEIRIGYACSLLRNTKKPVREICYESGYNTIPNFNKQFIKFKKTTPLQYRKYYHTRLTLRQNNIGIIES